ncbi:beta-1:3-galactosyltransferase 5-like protein [Dinothrombium tinctorium]|uniref:Hexosyltransferase n=1 Tax=Dinothrombium tinctorium TaxID=1965070 RepID=A0A3S3QCW6_9ACAR|nr:beta-1:3-galactosyltransferase 5-like protein [Dinothrombium tinctorium]
MVRWTRRWYRFLVLSICLSFLYILSDFRNERISKENDAAESNIRSFRPEKHFTRSKVDLKSAIDTSPNRLLHINDFRFLKNASHVCNDKDVYLAAFVHSAPSNFEKRRVIRMTWAAKHSQKQLRLKVVFLIGLPNNHSIQSLLDREQAQFGDLVQANFIDTYKNLTLKHLMGYKWILQFCNSSKFVMKADDDAFIDVYKVVQVLKNSFDNLEEVPKNILSCSLFPDGTLTKREGKWSLSMSEYPFDTYPSYCSGVAYFATPDVIYDLYKTASEMKLIVWIDDLFVTGIVASALRLRLQPLNLKFTYNDKDLRKWLARNDDKPSPYMVADIGYVDDWKFFMLKLWEKTSRVWK